MTHDHGPGPAAQRAAITLARAALTGDHDAAAAVAATLPCPVCLALTVTHYWIAVCAILDGERSGLVSEALRLRLLAAADAAQAELRAGPNLARAARSPSPAYEGGTSDLCKSARMARCITHHASSALLAYPIFVFVDLSRYWLSAHSTASSTLEKLS